MSLQSRISAFVLAVALDIKALTLGKQAASANLDAFSGLPGAANKAPYFTAANALALADSTEFGRSLGAAADGAAARVVLGLGAAATHAVQSSLTDTSSGAVTLAGAFGWGLQNSNLGVPGNDIDALRTTGSYRTISTTVGSWKPAIGQVLHLGQAGDYAAQVQLPVSGAPGIAFRQIVAGVAGGWNELYGTHNFTPSNYQLASVNGGALAGLTGTANKGLYFAGAGAMATYDLTSFGRSLGGSASDSAARTLLGADNASNLTSGTLSDARLAKSGPTALTLINSFTNAANTRYWKHAGIVFVLLDLERTTTPAGNVTIATLPSGFRPAVAVTGVAAYGQGSPLVVGPARVSVSTAGVVQHNYSVGSTSGASTYNLQALFSFPEA